jgi:hypothetical protein
LNIMRLLALCTLLASLPLAGCSPGTLGGAGATSGTGGIPGTGGVAGTGGTTGTGGMGSTSPGTTTLAISLPPTQSFCDENPSSCSSTQHLWIMTAPGHALTLGSVGCQLDCGSCTYPPCPEVPVIACPTGNFGVAIGSYAFVWDGSYVENGSCAPSTGGLAVSCVNPTYAPPGVYIAHFCATPGTLGTPDGGSPTCTATGPQECVDVDFPFPSPELALVALPAD